MVGDLSVAVFSWEAQRGDFVLLLPNPLFENKGPRLFGRPFDKLGILLETTGEEPCPVPGQSIQVFEE
jgi:hypothetical protein